MTRTELLAVEDRSIVPVSVPEWRTVLYVRSMTGHERAKLGEAAKAKPDDAAFLGLIYCVCDEHGQLIFTTDDVDALRQKNGMATERLLAAAMRLNAIDEAGVEAAKN